MLERK